MIYIVLQLGVSIPENTRETPVMIVSELCSNGDLFDYIRNVPAPSLKKVVRIRLTCLFFSCLCIFLTVEHHAGYCAWHGIPSYAQAFRHPQRLQIVQHPYHFSRHGKDCRLWFGQSETVHAVHGSQFSWHCQLASS
jgi:hypothetical protein